MTSIDDSVVNVRYLVDDVQAAIDFYTTHLGFTLRTAQLPAFADVTRGNLRLLLVRARKLRRPAHARRPPARTQAAGTGST